MNLSGQINEDYKAAFKAKDTAKVSTLRMLKSALKNKEIDLRHELSDEEVESIIRMQIKQLKDSAQTFRDAGRNELATSSEAEVIVLEIYLPKQLADEELTLVVKEAIAATGAETKADMGKAMGAAVKAVAGRADGSRIKSIVDSLLVAIILTILGVSVALPVNAQAFEILPNSETALLGVRVVRVILVFFGLLFIQQIIKGVFTYMLVGVRDDIRSGAIKKISGGFTGTLVIIGLISVMTIFLGNVA